MVKRIGVGLWIALTVVALVLAVVALTREADPGPRGPRGRVGAEGGPGPRGPAVSSEDEVITDLQSQLTDLESQLQEANGTIDCLNANIGEFSRWASSLRVSEGVTTGSFRLNGVGPFLRNC